MPGGVSIYIYMEERERESERERERESERERETERASERDRESNQPFWLKVPSSQTSSFASSQTQGGVCGGTVPTVPWHLTPPALRHCNLAALNKGGHLGPYSGLVKSESSKFELCLWGKRASSSSRPTAVVYYPCPFHLNPSILGRRGASDPSQPVRWGSIVQHTVTVARMATW